jgi:hypothetical protein
MLFGEHGADEADHRAAVGEDADDVGAAADLSVQPLVGVVRPDLSHTVTQHAGHLGHGRTGSSAVSCGPHATTR